MKIYQKLLTLLISFSVFFGCAGDKDAIPDPQNEIKTPQVISFKFLSNDNKNLNEDIVADINNTTQQVLVTFPLHTLITELIPSIKISEGANIEPNSQIQQDFSESIVYKLSGEGFKKVEYKVIASVMNSSKAEITDFHFFKSNNPGLKEDISALIENNTIKFQISDVIDISGLVPTISISDGASISPDNNGSQDFTKEVKYTVTAQDGNTKTEYLVQTTQLNSNNEITKFQFLINNKSYSANVDNNTNEITLKLPYNTDLSSLTPIVEIGKGAIINPESGVARNFNNEVTYEVTAEDGSKRTYSAKITTRTPAENDRAVLEEFYKANDNWSFNLHLNWDLDAPNMDNWKGVTISGGRVTGLLFTLINIEVLPASIGELSELEDLSLVIVHLNEIPKEIGNLKKLEYLNLSDNNLTSLPQEIGNMISLQTLDLSNNKLETLPLGIGRLDNLMILYLQKNDLTELPLELADLPKLLSLNIQNNPLTSIPEQICNMETETGIPIVIFKDAEDTCE